MQAGEPEAHSVQIFFAERAFDPREQFIFLEAHMIVQKFREVGHYFRLDGNLCSKAFLKIPYDAANFRVVCKYTHHLGILVAGVLMAGILMAGILIEPRMAGIGGQQHFFLLPEMLLAGLMPEGDELGRLTLHRRVALSRGGFGSAPHLERLNQREVVVLAQRMQARVAFQTGTSGRKVSRYQTYYPRECSMRGLPAGAADRLPQCGAIEVFPKVHQRQEGVENPSFHFIRQVQAAG